MYFTPYIIEKLCFLKKLDVATRIRYKCRPIAMHEGLAPHCIMQSHVQDSCEGLGKPT